MLLAASKSADAAHILHMSFGRKKWGCAKFPRKFKALLVIAP
jgi:hypothetical protein